MSDELQPTGEDLLAELLALDAIESDELSVAEGGLDTWPLEQAAAVVPLAEAVSTEPPEDLRGDVLAAALARRPAGRPVSSPQPVPPAEAFARTIEDFWSLLESLEDDEWELVAHDDHGRVRDLTAHLIGVERLNLRWVEAADEVPYLPDHVASTRAVVESFAEAPLADVARTWHESALALLAVARERDGAQEIPFHDITVSVDGLMTIRTFELWAHGMDIAHATGRSLPMLDDSRLLLMSSRLMAALPRALAYRGLTGVDHTARFVLTGPAGGCYDIALDPTASRPPPGYEPDVTIIADVVDLCLVAAARLEHADLERTLEGDPALAELVLAHVSAFARD
jgi:uncharacterized protein (TIGR03083 family)